MKTFKELFEEKNEKDAYDKLFMSILKSFGVEDVEDLSKEQKKEFFDKVDKAWKSEKEKD